jgi:hypothetical protein
MATEIIDIDGWERKSQFLNFNKYSHPVFSIGVRLDVSNLVDYCKNNKRSFFITFLYIVTKNCNEIKELNQKEEWSVLKYIGPTTEEIGLTNGKNYYWPTSKNNPVYNGVFDDEEIRSYLYPTDEKFWIILEDPTGMAYNTIYGNGRKLLEEDYNRMLEEEGWIHFKGE